MEDQESKALGTMGALSAHLIDALKADKQMRAGWSPLEQELSKELNRHGEEFNADRVDALIARGANPHAPSSAAEGSPTVLMMAISLSSMPFEAVSRALSGISQADAERVDYQGWNLAHFAQFNQNQKVHQAFVDNPTLRALLERPDENGELPKMALAAGPARAPRP